MKIRLHIVLAVALAFLAGCRGDPEKEANKLFVESAQILEQYRALPQKEPAQYEGLLRLYENRLNLLQQVDEKLSSILEEYPESSLAVELASTGSVKGIKKSEVEELITSFEQDTPCVKSLYAARKGTIDQFVGSCAFTAALKLAEGVSEQNRSEAFTAVVKAQATAGDVSGAIELAKDVGVEGGLLMAAVAEGQAASGDISGALLSAQRISNERHRANALAAVAKAQATSGDASGALKLAEGIIDPANRASVLAAAGDVSGALKLAEDVDVGWSRSEALAAVAKAQATAGDVSGALKLADDVTDVGGWLLAAVAEGQAASGDAAGALKLAERVENPWAHVSVLAAVAQSKATAGDVAGALELVEGVADDTRRVIVLAAVAGVLINNK